MSECVCVCVGERGSKEGRSEGVEDVRCEGVEDDQGSEDEGGDSIRL